MLFLNSFLFSLLISNFGHAYAGPVVVDPSVHPVVQYLVDQGIEVEMVYDSYTTFPGEPTFQEKLKIFWQELDLVKEEIANRGDKITTLTVSSYTDWTAGV